MRRTGLFLHFVVLPGLLSLVFSSRTDAGVAYGDPAGGWIYTYTGDAAVNNASDRFESLDGRWDQRNGSAQWDGSAIGIGSPGGAMSITEGDTSYLRMQDTGNPTDAGLPDPSNRKMYFVKNMTIDGASETVIDDGVTLSFRARIPTDGPLDNYANGNPWTPGDGYVNHDGGKSTFTISQPGDGGKTISFFLANEEEDQTNFEGPGLGMNSRGATSPNNDVVDWQGDEGTQNILFLDDPTEWHEFWVNIIQAPGLLDATHVVSIYKDGSLIPDIFNVTAGRGREGDYNDGGAALSEAGLPPDAISYLALGFGATPQAGAVDVDFFSWTTGFLDPPPPQRNACDFNNDVSCDISDLDDLLYIGIANNDLTYDIDESGTVDLQDRDEWLKVAGQKNVGEDYVLGDTDLDNKVDPVDLNNLALSWNTNEATSYAQGDFNGDGTVGPVDLNDMALNWNHNVARAAGAAVPEPHSGLLLALGVLLVCQLRRRK